MMSANLRTLRRHTSPHPTSRGSMTDKQEKLLQEYQRIKSANTVLKGAVRQEQEHVRILERKLKEALNRQEEIERLHHAALEDNDQLEFNNNRLTKRVESLMKELEETATAQSKSGGWFLGLGSSVADVERLQSSLDVASEELRIKIHENEAVHMESFEIKKKNELKVRELELEITDAQRRCSNETAKHATAIAEWSDMRRKLECELSAQTAIRREQEEVLAQTREQLGEKQRKLQGMSASLTAKVEWLQDRIRSKLLLDDTEFSDLNRLNIPYHDRKYLSHRAEILSRLQRLVSSLSGGFEDYHAAWRSRIEFDGSSMHEIGVKLLSSFDNVTTKFTVLLKSLDSVCIGAQTEATGDAAVWNWDSLLSSLSSLVRAMHTSTGYQILRFRMEGENSQIVETQSRNDMICATMRRLQCGMATILSYMKIGLIDMSNATAEARLIESVENVYQILKVLCTQLSSKSAIEKNAGIVLPDANPMAAIVTMTTSVSKMASVLREYFRLSDTHESFDMHPLVASFRTRSQKYIASIVVDQDNDINAAVDAYRQLESRNRELVEQLQARQPPVAEQVAVNDSCIQTDPTPIPTHIPTLDAATQVEGRHYAFQLRRHDGSEASWLSITDETISRDSMLKRQFSERESVMLRQVGVADAKALKFRSETEAALARIGDLEDECKALNAMRLEEKRRTAAARDELETTRLNYDRQMQIMTENLLELTQKANISL